MKLFDVGPIGAVGVPGSLSASDSSTSATSANTVGTPSTTVTTSDERVPDISFGSAPDAAFSALMTRYDDALPSRVSSPHDTDATIRMESTALFMALTLQNPRRDEYQQLAAFVLD